MENGKVFLNHCSYLDTSILDYHDFIFTNEIDTSNGILYLRGNNVIHDFW